MQDSSTSPAVRDNTFHRSIGLFSGTAINMTQMCGIGPFITIPIMVAAMGGPQAVIGWIAGAILAMADGLVWAELGAAMPGSGGTYVYLREAFQYRTGKLMPFLFIWTMLLAIPLLISAGGRCTWSAWRQRSWSPGCFIAASNRFAPSPSGCGSSC
jgi:amino acid transporter